MLSSMPVGCFFPTYRMLEDTWREFKRVFSPVSRSKNESEHRLELITGGTLEMWSLDSSTADSVRGHSYRRIIVDEAAIIPNLLEVWNEIIRPTLADFEGDAFFKSTPKGRNGFWNLFQRGEKGEAGWKAFRFPTTANPFIKRSEIAAMKAEMPEITFRQEILAEFIDDNGGVFRKVQDAVFGEMLTEPEKDRQYSASVDVAANVDFTVVTVWDDQAKRAVFIDRFNRVDYPALEDRLVATYKRWHLTGMTVESNSIGQPVIDHLRARGLYIKPFVTTQLTKQAIIQGLQAGFENGEIGIPNHAVLIGELLAFESKRNAGGTFSYSAPDGLHDDCVMSLAIGWNAVSRKGSILF